MSNRIVIGDVDGKASRIDLDTLLRTRLLIQANSGGGKSWLMRRLAEQLFGKVPVIIIDPEGEFATLREKFGFVLVGQGGETPADVRSAGLVAETLLKLRASAVCDLFEAFRKTPQQRHEWVKRFLEAMLDADKRLWRDTIIFIDEAHTFCPEKGESVASGAMQGMCTAGRKRHFCSIWATQRLALVNKNASSQLLNRLVGMTFEDVDVDRAIELLSVGKDDKHDFKKAIKLLEPGQFYGFGRAISKDRILINVGDVETSHEEDTAARAAMGPPPPPEAIKDLLPKLADLPKEAEEKLRTEAEFRKEIRSLKAQLASRPVEKVGDLELRKMTKPWRKVVEEAMKIIAKINAIGFDGTTVTKEEVEKAMQAASSEIAKLAAGKLKGRASEFDKLRREAASALERMRRMLGDETVEVSLTVKHNEPFTVEQPSRVVEVKPAANNGELTGPERKILTALAELRSIGKEQPPKTMVAAWSSYSPVGGAFGNPMGALRTKGFIDYPQPGAVVLTDSGRAIIGDIEPPDQDEIWRRISTTCTGPEVKILRALIDNAGENEIEKSLLAEKAGYSPVGGAFGNPIGALRTKGLLDYPRQGMVKAADWLFV